jgi:uncharacterized protein (UPF0332 family)
MVADLPEQLIAQAEDLLRKGPTNEATVRRSVSAAYYSLFHLLVRDAIANWREAEDHPRLARVFEHRQMKAASIATVAEWKQSKDGSPEDTLKWVAQAFIDLQNARHQADYDTAEPFDPLKAAVLVAQARIAIEAWPTVKARSITGRYLYSLLFRDRA